VLPFLAATRPAAARAMLEYRLRRLPAAQATARARQRAGARFPWESARSGVDVTPPYARDRLGDVIPIRTGQLEEHIVAQIPWAACCYVDWTGDDEFAQGPALRLLTETARYWRSRARHEPDGSAHIYGVIGPDEYHEPVDDNAFTNVMARWNLRRAADAVEASPTPPPDVDADEILAWRDVADRLVDGLDGHTGVYEQFAGFHRLETLLIEEVAPSRPIAADLLLGAERVRGAQVLKQADVLMLHHLIPEEVAPSTLEPNLRFYEPRTAHGSSLSPAVHASLLARARDHRRALEALRVAARIDLDDLTGSSAVGMHLASMGGLWQALVFGFAGVRPSAGRLRIDPHLPPTWGALEVRVRFHGSRLDIRIARDVLTVHADEPTPVNVGNAEHTVDAGGLRLARRGAAWEVTP
jgi:trehalose/maltose hydrolase-like predicted phosphorylase